MKIQKADFYSLNNYHNFIHKKHQINLLTFNTVTDIVTVNNGGDYLNAEFATAVHALVYLNHRGNCISSDEIAENVCTNPARIRKVMAKLKKAKLVNSKEGKNAGGYSPIKNLEEVTLLDIFNAVDDNVVSMNWKSGDKDKECLISSGMADIMSDIAYTLDNNCKKLLSQITINDINKKIFKEE